MFMILHCVMLEKFEIPGFCFMCSNIFMFIGSSPPSGGVCGETAITSAGSVIMSPNHPNNYANSQDCEWLVTFPEGQTVSLNFLAFSLERSSTCRYIVNKILQIH